MGSGSQSAARRWGETPKERNGDGALEAAAAGQVLEELERILESASFRKGARLSRLLRYIVEATLEGETGQLKESIIGLEVFERPAFDPRMDTVVRSTVRHLRFKLDEYYKTEGAADAVLIELPKGTYVPVFRRRAGQAEALPETLPETTPAAAPQPAASVAARRLPAMALIVGVALTLTVGVALALRTQRMPPIDSLAVLPFENRTGYANLQYVADGLTGEIIAASMRIPGLRVIAPSSAAAAQSLTMQRAGRELNVGAVLTGSVESAAGGMRVRARVESVERPGVLWSEDFTVKGREIGPVEAPIVRATARSLGLTAGPAVFKTETPNAEAHDLYIQGRYVWARRNRENVSKSVGFFEQAIARDASYALAYIGLADAYATMAANDMMPSGAALPKAEAAAARALALAPDSAEAHASLGLIKRSEWDWKESERQLRVALKLNPGYGITYQRLAVTATVHRRFDEADALLRQAQILDPTNWMLTYSRGENAYYAGRYDEAMAQAGKIREAAPGGACNLMERVYFRRGMLREARAAADCEFEGEEGFEADLMKATSIPDKAVAERRLRSVIARAPAGRDAFMIAMAAARLGLVDLSLDWLERAYELHTPDLVSIGIEPDIEPLRREARYRALVKKMGLEE